MGTATSSTMKSARTGQSRTPIPMSGFGGLVRKTALLNLGIILSATAIAATLRRPASFLIIAFVVPMVSVVLWATTFAISAFVSLCRIFWGQGLRGTRRSPRHLTGGGGVGDPWLDGPA